MASKVTDPAETPSLELMAESLALYNAIINTAVEAIVTIDADGQIETFNGAAEQLFGYAAEEIVGEKVNVLMPANEARHHDQYIDRYLNGGEARIIGIGREIRARHKNGSEFPAYLSVGEIRHLPETKFVALMRDITREKQAEHDARVHREQLAHADRLYMLGEMAAGIAHELNQPLTAISLFSQAGARLLQQGDTAQLQDVFEKLNDHAIRAGDIIERMRGMARADTTGREIVDLKRLICDCLALVENEAHAKKIDIVIRCDDDPMPSVRADAVQIQQVVINLVRNAIEAMNETNAERARRIEISLVHNEDVMRVSVADNGEGVSDNVAPTLFSPFSTTKKSGMGMGLSISRAIVRAHGGDLGFHNNEDGGATFYFSLKTDDERG